jgi:sugar lactone lactonase YvrE
MCPRRCGVFNEKYLPLPCGSDDVGLYDILQHGKYQSMTLKHPIPTASPATVLFQANATLAEGPIWDGRAGCLYWVDIRRCRVSRFDAAMGRQTGVWITPARAGCIGLTRDPGRLIVAAGAEVALLTLGSGAWDVIAKLPIDAPRYRANDGRVDSSGRFWVGTMIDDIHRPTSFDGGALFRIDKNGSVTRTLDGCELPNGIGWSPDDSRMYLNDTTTAKTWQFAFDSLTGSLSDRQVFFDHSSGAGFPDGLSVDATGAVWSAQWDGWNVRRIAPDGKLLAEFPMPVRRPSSASFFGPVLDQMVVTSATVDFTSCDYRQSPDAGSLFAMPTPGITGQPENLFDI